MAGYSGTPLPKKLGIKEGCRLVIIGAPPEFERKTLGELPVGVTVQADTRTPTADVIVYFVMASSKLRDRINALKGKIKPDGAIWVAWPKKASGVKTDVTEDTIRTFALPIGLVDNKVCAIDTIWSGLRLVIRRELRGK